MSALTKHRNLTIPAQQIRSARHRSEPTPAAREWMAGLDQDKLHRLERWERSPAGWMYARCGVKARLWMSLEWVVASGRERCLSCEDVADAT